MGMSFRTSFLAVIALTGQIVNANWGFGWCDPFGPKTISNMDVERYSGNWYNIQKDKDFLGGITAGCGTASYTYLKDEWWNFWPLEIRNRNWDKDTDTLLTGEIGSTGIPQGVARCAWGTGNCNVKFYFLFESPYMVMDTDFDNYSMVYGCDTYGIVYVNYVWILSRAQSLSTAHMDHLYRLFKSRIPTSKYPIDDIMVTTQHGGDCKYAF